MERQALLDPVDHGLVDLAYLAQLALPLRTFRRSEMAQARLTTQDLARGGHFQPLGSRFLRLATCDGSWHNLGRRTLGIELRLSTAFYAVNLSGARMDGMHARAGATELKRERTPSTGAQTEFSTLLT